MNQEANENKAQGAADAGSTPDTNLARRVLCLTSSAAQTKGAEARNGAGSRGAKAKKAPSKNASMRRAAERASNHADRRAEGDADRHADRYVNKHAEERKSAREEKRAVAGKGERKPLAHPTPTRPAFEKQAKQGNAPAAPRLRRGESASGAAASGRASDGDRTGRFAGKPAGNPVGGAGSPANQRRNVWRSSDAAGAGAVPARAAGTAPVQTRQVQATALAAPSAATTSAAPAGATTDAPAGTRLNKRMADLGICSRREADDWIARGWVFVNGEPAAMGQRVQASDSIHVDKAAYVLQEQQVTFLLHKPVGYVSGQPEDGYPSAATLLGNGSRWRGDKSSMRFLPRQLRGLAPAGRLDIDSTGLLVLTQDGRIARQLIGSDSSTDKEYLVRVEYATPQGVVREQVQAVFPPAKLALLRHGLSLDGQALQPAQVDWQNPEQLRFVLREGKKRQIRRMCEAVGLHVVGLKRVRIGRIMLGDLPSGQWRFLRADEGF